MNSLFAPSAALAAATPLLDTSSALIAAARLLLPDLERGRAIDAKTLRAAMMAGFGGSDTDGVWDWKTAYEACEAAQVLFLRKFGPAMRARANAPAALLAMLAKVAALLPSHTRRSEESQALQQFSTPLALGLVASAAAAITPADLVLEPSAGTGLACDLCRTGRRSFGPQRTRRHPRRPARPAVPRHYRHALRRRPHPRPSRCGGASRPLC